MRLFVGIWPGAETLAGLKGLTGSEVDGIRWIAPEQLHVTLRFLGEVTPDDVPKLTAALVDVGERMPAVTATLGPMTQRFGGRMLVLPMAGVDALAEVVARATADVGRPDHDRPFVAHVTLCRTRGRRRLPRTVVPQEASLSWDVRELALVRSQLSREGARYETLLTVPLEGGS